MTIQGSCLCGGVKYEIQGTIGRVVNCHCSMCRKATGAAFRTRAAVRKDAFRWLTGEELVSGYDSSPNETRTFCRVCGSTLPTFFRDHPEQIGLPLGTLDADPGARPSAHVWVNSKAPWWEITDGLPQHNEGLALRTLDRSKGDEPTPLSGVQFFDDAATHAAYQARRASGQAPNETMESPAFDAMLGDVRGSDVLDLGCGDGSYGRELLRRGCRSYSGLDASARMIADAEETLRGTGGRVLQGAIEEYSFPSDAFDAVISRMTFHWLSDLTPTFAGIARCLRPGGRLVFSVEHPVITSRSEVRADDRQRTQWLVDDYFISGPRSSLWFGATVQKYHRTLEDYFCRLQQAGLHVEDLKEATPSPDCIRDPVELRRRQRVPLILLLRAQRAET